MAVVTNAGHTGGGKGSMLAVVRSLARRAVCAVRSRTLVLAYHRVGDGRGTAPWVTTSVARFEQQMAYLAACRLVVPLDRLLADLRRGRTPRGGRVVLTFDDAAVDAYTAALPVLQRLGLPATLFVPTGLIGRPGPFWWDRLYCLGDAAAARGLDLAAFLIGAGFLDGATPAGFDALWRRLRMLDLGRRDEALARAAEWLGGDDGRPAPGAMSWEQLTALDAGGVFTLGAHTVSHPVLASLDGERLREETARCRDALAGFRGFRPVFAYPYGDEPAVGAAARRAARDAGYEAAFTTEETALTGRDDPFALGRVCVDDMPLDAFRWVIDHHLAA